MKSLHKSRESIGSYISSFHRIGSAFLAQKYEKYNIGFGQYQFLMKLYIEDGLSHEELTKRVHVDKATTTRAISKLSENGFVVITKDENDKRKFRIFLTDYSKSIKDDIWNIALEWENQLIGFLDEKDVKELYKIFEKVAKDNEWMSIK